MKLTLGMLTADQPPVTFADLLTGAATAVLAAAGGWLAVVVLAVLVEALTEGRLQPVRLTGAPVWLRRALLGAVVAGLSVAGIGPAAVADGPGARQAARTAALEGLPLPDRPPGGVRPETGVSPAVRAVPPGEAVTVRAGDSLWSIAEDLLPHATDAELVQAVHALHRSNRDQLHDPDLLHPGQRLRLPPALDQHHPDRQEQQ
ncbi:MAG TPA: LysM peptidoglycan-binding domain-containing protein [Marmoricola sp.]|nr:LysM peptidoglycan-binding domain-containing protein [Marmoricola sp.]